MLLDVWTGVCPPGSLATVLRDGWHLPWPARKLKLNSNASVFPSEINGDLKKEIFKQQTAGSAWK